MMMFLQLTLLTLFIASPGSLIYAENVITCGRNVQRLACASGVINVQSAFYGRTSAAICRANQPPGRLANTWCHSTISAIPARCNGRRVCEFNANIVGSFDPCPGTSKYFSTTYTCIRREDVLACEHSNAVLACDHRTIIVLSANYGRTDRRTCTRGRRFFFFWFFNTRCYQRNSTFRVMNRCNGRRTCVVPATNRFFSDPCFGTYKYLKVSYACV